MVRTFTEAILGPGMADADLSYPDVLERAMNQLMCNDVPMSALNMEPVFSKFFSMVIFRVLSIECSHEPWRNCAKYIEVVFPVSLTERLEPGGSLLWQPHWQDMPEIRLIVIICRDQMYRIRIDSQQHSVSDNCYIITFTGKSGTRHSMIRGGQIGVGVAETYPEVTVTMQVLWGGPLALASPHWDIELLGPVRYLTPGARMGQY